MAGVAGAGVDIGVGVLVLAGAVFGVGVSVGVGAAVYVSFHGGGGGGGGGRCRCTRGWEKGALWGNCRFVLGNTVVGVRHRHRGKERKRRHSVSTPSVDSWTTSAMVVVGTRVCGHRRDVYIYDKYHVGG